MLYLKIFRVFVGNVMNLIRFGDFKKMQMNIYIYIYILYIYIYIYIYVYVLFSYFEGQNILG